MATQETAARMLSRLDGFTVDVKTNERNCALLVVDCANEIRAMDLYAFVMTVDPLAELVHSVHGPGDGDACPLHPVVAGAEGGLAPPPS